MKKELLDSKKKIKNAYISMLEKKENPNVREMCRIAGVNKSTFYYYYPYLEMLEKELYKDEILPDFQKEKLENLFNENNLYFEYFQVKYNMNDTLNKIHNCLNETFNEDNNNKKKSQLNIIEEKHEYKIQEMIERIFIKLYENKMGVIYDHNKKKFITKNSKEEDNSNSNCNIF